MIGKPLIIIPIYYRSLEEYSTIMNKRKTRDVNEIINMLTTQLKATNEDVERIKKDHENYFDKYNRIHWKYSQIIGYIELQIVNSRNIIAYYWFVSAKKISDKLKNRTMIYQGKLCDVSNLSKSNTQIKKDINNFLKILPRLRKKFNKRFFDVRALENIIDAIDFKKLR